MNENLLLESILKYVGQTVTIFTESGGISGSGFTGVLAGVSCNTVKLITDIGAAPSCAVGSNCNCGFTPTCKNGACFGPYGTYYNNGNCAAGYNNNGYVGAVLGSVTEIPVDKIVSFVHNAI